MKIVKSPNGGEVLDATLTMYPSRLEVVVGRLELNERTSTSYGYVVDGSANVLTPHFQFQADQGAFFSVPGEFVVESHGHVVLIHRLGYRGLLLAGRIEGTGRLTYIDGCSSTLLIPPARAGDPVLNHLHIPPSIEQSQHTHPSLRFGVIARGSGVARYHCGSGNEIGEERLEAGTVFLIDAQELHSFKTMPKQGGLDVITYHPDSDWGPTDAAHPMLSGTHVRSKK